MAEYSAMWITEANLLLKVFPFTMERILHADGLSQGSRKGHRWIRAWFLSFNRFLKLIWRAEGLRGFVPHNGRAPGEVWAFLLLFQTALETNRAELQSSHRIGSQWIQTQAYAAAGPEQGLALKLFLVLNLTILETNRAELKSFGSWEQTF